jgi:ankyrin repeat protein
MTALHLATYRSVGRADLVKHLLTHGADPNAKAGSAPPRRFDESGIYGDESFLIGATPLIIAAADADVPVMRALLDGGANPRMTSTNGATLLMAATGLGRPVRSVAEPRVLDVLRFALELGQDVKATDKNGATALHIAVSQETDPVIRLLVDKGADVNARNARGLTPLDIAEGTAGKGSNQTVVHERQAKLLRELGGKLGAELGEAAAATAAR